MYIRIAYISFNIFDKKILLLYRLNVPFSLNVKLYILIAHIFFNIFDKKITFGYSLKFVFVHPVFVPSPFLIQSHIYLKI